LPDSGRAFYIPADIGVWPLGPSLRRLSSTPANSLDSMHACISFTALHGHRFHDSGGVPGRSLRNVNRSPQTHRLARREIVHMQPLRVRRHPLRHASSTHYISQPGSIAVSTHGGLDQSESRYEPETFGVATATAADADPYAAWLEQREADRQREDHPRVRWVVRPRAAAGPAIRVSAVGDREAIERRDQCDGPSSARLTTA
jgi:hypothetical protein